jgi:hypothetical protein
MVYTLLYWTVIIIVLLNVIFGIIIDTFSELRSDSLRRKQDTQNRCFICRIDRFTFDTKGNGFETHIKQDHNMWNYLNMIVHVREKDLTEHNGWEGYIAQMMQVKDLSFFPRNQAISLSRMKAREQEESRRSASLVTKTAQQVEQMLGEHQLILSQQQQILQGLDAVKEAQTRLEDPAEAQVRADMMLQGLKSQIEELVGASLQSKTQQVPQHSSGGEGL